MTLTCVWLALLGAQAKEHRVVIEVNVPGTVAYGTVLNNADNLRRAFAPERASIEIVCHGAGIGLLLTRGPLALRIARLAKGGVVFAACANTLRGRHLALSTLPTFSRVVPSGVAEVVRRQEAGWSYLKGGF